ncbi:DNA-directed RNA polymerase subunit beta [Glaciibacter flavus]|uniref:DNA-directed RNA polymerase subunit beta n=1 Tax=Orlajensenia flava TaxID=2565934 RepID=UPI003B003B84
MADRIHKPTKFPSRVFEAFHGGDDPAQLSRVAHETANALLSRVRENPDPEIVERLVGYTDEHGIDAVAELWSRASARSLPGALWRLYLVRLLIRQDPTGTSFLYQRGTEVSTTIDQVVAGAPNPTSPDDIVTLADAILRGIFAGDFGVALDRAGAFCRVMAAGATSLADDTDATAPERATELTTRALRFAELADEFSACARLWRTDSLD